MPLTDSDVEAAIDNLQDGLELVIIRGTEARWRARRGVYFEVELDRASALIDELSEYYRIRSGVSPPGASSRPNEKKAPSCPAGTTLAVFSPTGGSCSKTWPEPPTSPKAPSGARAGEATSTPRTDP